MKEMYSCASFTVLYQKLDEPSCTKKLTKFHFKYLFSSIFYLSSNAWLFQRSKQDEGALCLALTKLEES